MISLLLVSVHKQLSHIMMNLVPINIVIDSCTLTDCKRWDLWDTTYIWGIFSNLQTRKVWETGWACTIFSTTVLSDIFTRACIESIYRSNTARFMEFVIGFITGMSNVNHQRQGPDWNEARNSVGCRFWLDSCLYNASNRFHCKRKLFRTRPA